MNHTEAIREVLDQLAERAHRDETFKQLLVTDPFSAAQQAGVLVPGEVKGWMKFRLVEDRDSARLFILHGQPADEPATSARPLSGFRRSRRFALC